MKNLIKYRDENFLWMHRISVFDIIWVIFLNPLRTLGERFKIWQLSSEMCHTSSIFFKCAPGLFHICVIIWFMIKFHIFIRHITACEKNNIKQCWKIWCIFIFTCYMYIMLLWNWKLATYQQSMTCILAPVCIPPLWIVLTHESWE